MLRAQSPDPPSVLRQQTVGLPHSPARLPRPLRGRASRLHPHPRGHPIAGLPSERSLSFPFRAAQTAHGKMIHNADWFCPYPETP
eukprot:641613-Amphidinium_carterae.1